MEIDPQILLGLLAIRQLGGGEPVSASGDVFAKGLKKPLETAKTNGWVRVVKITVAATGKNGITKPKKVDAFQLTPEGEKVIRDAGRPEVTAAAATAYLESFKAQLETDRIALRDQILAVLSEKTKSNPVLKEMGNLSKAVNDLAKRLEKMEAQLTQGNESAVLEKIDDAFRILKDRLVSFSVSPVKAGLSEESPPVKLLGEKSLRKALKDSYDDLCMLIEFEDNVVPLPRLFHQAKSVIPNLSVELFRLELIKLWDERIVDLKVINEPHLASEPDKAIRRGDDIFYFVFWRNQ